MQWGADHENAVRQMYIETMKCKNKRVSVFEKGLIVNPTYLHLGSSPDGVVYSSDEKHYHILLEIKCPYKYTDLSPLEAAKNRLLQLY